MDSNSSLMDSFTKALSYYSSIAGKTKKEIADGIGVPPTTFSSWSNGKHLPDMDKLQILAKYLNAPITQFFNFTATEPTPDPLLMDLVQIYPKLSNDDKLLVRAVALRIYQLYHTEE